MNLPVQHLSDEAVAAFADGVLGAGPRARAERHLADCAECSYSVAEQRAAVWALRAAPAPALPGGLLDRLRALPSTTSLPPSTSVVLAPDGSPMFPAYGMHGERHPSLFTRLMPMSVPARRRGQQVVLVTAAAALVVVGAAGSSAAASLNAPAQAQQVAHLSPAGDSSGNVAGNSPELVHDVSSSGQR